MAEAAREMTPDELFEKARSHRLTSLTSLTPPPPGDDVVMLSLMADERAHRRADAKLDRLIDGLKREMTAAQEFRDRCVIHADGGPDRRWRDRLAGVIVGGLAIFVAGVIMRLLGV